MIERVTEMRTSLKVLMCGFGTGRIVDRFRELAFEVWGEHCMDRTAMDMTHVPMMMISLGMDMKQRDQEHPCR